jgi:hypothetical protein
LRRKLLLAPHFSEQGQIHGFKLLPCRSTEDITKPHALT